MTEEREKLINDYKKKIKEHMEVEAKYVLFMKITIP
jgi:hypothetical protein